MIEPQLRDAAEADLNWRRVQRENFTRLPELCDYLELGAGDRRQLLKSARFPLNLPRRLAAKIAKGRLDDPLLLQFLPVRDEMRSASGYSSAPVQDERFVRAGRLVQKYAGRALLLVTSACAMHCRYCFRQNYPYSPSGDWEGELGQIRRDQHLEEIILSGGDPLSLSDLQLQRLLEGLAEIPHLRRLRVHTRFPLGIPERLNRGFLELLAASRLKIWFVIHANHAHELDEEVMSALGGVQRLGIPVLNQAVLLKGVNDDLSSLRALSLALADGGIFFYYLHLLDRVSGAQRFEVSDTRAAQLVDELRGAVPGYAVPTLVREVPGQLAKTPIHI